MWCNTYFHSPSRFWPPPLVRIRPIRSYWPFPARWYNTRQIGIGIQYKMGSYKQNVLCLGKLNKIFRCMTYKWPPNCHLGSHHYGHTGNNNHLCNSSSLCNGNLTTDTRGCRQSIKLDTVAWHVVHNNNNTNGVPNKAIIPILATVTTSILSHQPSWHNWQRSKHQWRSTLQWDDYKSNYHNNNNSFLPTMSQMDEDSEHHGTHQLALQWVASNPSQGGMDLQTWGCSPGEKGTKHRGYILLSQPTDQEGWHMYTLLTPQHNYPTWQCPVLPNIVNSDIAINENIFHTASNPFYTRWGDNMICPKPPNTFWVVLQNFGGWPQCNSHQNMIQSSSLLQHRRLMHC